MKLPTTEGIEGFDKVFTRLAFTAFRVLFYVWIIAEIAIWLGKDLIKELMK